MINYVSNNYEKLKKTIGVATQGNYSDEFYHYLILELESIKASEIKDKEAFIFTFAKNQYRWEGSKWNRNNSKNIFTEYDPKFISEDMEIEDSNNEYLNLIDKEVSRYLHTFENEQDEIHKKIVMLYISSKNQFDLLKRFKIESTTLKTSIAYVSRNFNRNRYVVNDTSVK